MENPNERWQTEVNGQVYESTFAELIQWINEGALLPQDMVRRGNLRWIEARRVPALVQFFNARENGAPPPVMPTTSAPPQTPLSETPAVQTQNFVPAGFGNESHLSFAGRAAANAEPFGQAAEADQPAPDRHAAAAIVASPNGSVCSMHPDAAAVFVCDTCANAFCKICPKSYGGSVKICPYCGAMCRPFEEIRKKRQQAMNYETALGRGFGVADFFEALAYPFKFKTSLFFGAVLFMLFSIGQSAASFGMSFYLLGAAVFCWMLANMLTFGVLAHTVENFAQGKAAEDFMPSFDDFSLLDDVLHPFFLCIGTYLVSFGLFLAVVVGIVWFTWTTFAGQSPMKIEDRVTASQYEQEKRTGSETLEFSDAGAVKSVPGLDVEEMDKLQKLMQEQRQKEIESVVGKTRAQQEADYREMAGNFMRLGVPALLAAGLLLLWGLFYYPAACLVAGYTRSFAATVNPSVGWETIRLLGFDYVKILLAWIVIGVAGFCVAVFLSIVLSPFEMPGMGNLPVKAAAALFGFYFSVVLSVFMGLALYKNADKLNLFKG